jgi:undecaprenyl-diphosphatase
MVGRALYRPREDRADARAPQRSLGGKLLLGGLAALLVAVPFTLLALLVLSKWAPLARLDADVASSLNRLALRSEDMVDVLRVLAVVLDPWVFRVVVVAVSVWLWQRGARRLALWAVTTTVIGGVLGAVLKYVVERARPTFDEPVAHASGYSFPSGHALNSFLCTGVLVLVFLPVLTAAGRRLAYAIAGFVVLLTGYDRVALGVHYVSDVVAGWIVATACLAGTAAAFEIWRREQGRRPSTPSEGVEPEAAPELSDPPADAASRGSRRR